MSILKNLRPYKSFLLLRAKGIPESESTLGDLACDLLAIKNSACFDDDSVDRESGEQDGLEVQTIRYRLKLPVAWSRSNDIRNTVHHLMVIIRNDSHVLVHSSDRRVYGWVLAELADEGKLADYVERIDESVVNAALIGRSNKVKALWLGGTHKRTPLKPDNKHITGFNLREALDPLGDQTFRFSALKCEPFSDDLGVKQYGVNPGGSRIWIGASNDQVDFIRTAKKLLERMDDDLQPDTEPVQVLCVPEVSASDITGAYDISLVPPWFADDGDMEGSHITEVEKWEKWTEQASYEIANASSANAHFDLALSWQGTDLGSLHFELDTRKLPSVKYKITPVNTPSASAAELAEAAEYFGYTQGLSVWYESSHTVCGGSVVKQKFRDMSFNRIQWADFSGFKPYKEKPLRQQVDENNNPKTDAKNQPIMQEDIRLLGTQDSLFCWLKNEGDKFFGDKDYWLACDDAANEMFDFAWFAPGEEPVLRLIHIKAATSASDKRKVSVSSFEVVTGQAIKNLRYLDGGYFEEGMGDGLDRIAAKLVWHNQQQSDRASFLAAVRQAGSGLQREVVIIQPHITSDAYADAIQGKSSDNASRMKLLNILLLNTRAACSQFCADFRVICAK